MLSAKVDNIACFVDKFETFAAENVRDENANVIVQVDESHRSQYSETHSKMRQVFTHACYTGFTGTPLTKGEKDTVLKFGSFIHKYPMRQAVQGKVVVPLLCQSRLALTHRLVPGKACGSAAPQVINCELAALNSQPALR